ncbi:hypothetical protein [Undibacterium sp. TS12]|uniref:hypothetical protein n=1 Tax=Undibacterium sp. TS12 TaxID=2908202 RepID=UPI001F4D0F27|nr:hypothetical protein [Undibacterium sp. TS12]MCH8621988.1 hypothetical protein [Undibacterium sp. TS12]
MSQDIDVHAWLDELATDELVRIDGYSVYLRLYPDGAELGLHLQDDVNLAQISQAMQAGFSHALDHAAGLALTEDGNILLLSQWLPAVSGWLQASAALESLLDLAAQWRAGMHQNQAVPQPRVLAKEQRMRAHLQNLTYVLP